MTKAIRQAVAAAKRDAAATVSRSTSLGVGVMLAGLASWALLAGEPIEVRCTIEHPCGTGGSPDLCVNGHPSLRQAGVTYYGGLPPKAGYQRDHRIPLCLGGADTRENVWYQPLDEARAKDAREWAACEAYCAGRITLEQARRQF